MQNNYANTPSYGENYYAPVVQSDISLNNGYPQIDTDALKAQQAGYQVEGNTKKIYTVYEHYPEPQQPRIQTVIEPKKPHNCGKCEDCDKRREREREERLQRERDECIAGCLIEFCCLVLCKAIFNSR